MDRLSNADYENMDSDSNEEDIIDYEENERERVKFYTDELAIDLRSDALQYISENALPIGEYLAEDDIKGFLYSLGLF